MTINSKHSLSLNLLILAVFLSQSISLFRIFDTYSVSPAFCAVIVYSFYAIFKAQTRNISIVILLAFYSFLTILFYRYEFDLVEYFKSFVQISLFLFVVLTSLRPIKVLQSEIIFPLVVKAAIVILIVFELYQVCSFVFLADYSPWFFLDGFSISTADDPGRFSAVNLAGFLRPISLYHEPSYLAFVLFELLVIGRNYNIGSPYTLSCLLGIILTVSSVVFIFLGIYLLFCKSSPVRSSIRKLVLFFLPVILIIFGGLFYESLRLDELSIPGTSGHERITLPLYYVVDELSSSPLGVPFGNIPFQFNNSFFLLFAYFGVATLFFLGLFYIAFKKMRNNKYDMFPYILVILCLSFITGALFTVESAFFVLFLNYSYFYDKSSTKFNNCYCN